MGRVLAVCNQKGGVGKTTYTFHLAGAAARAGERVLLIDADPQGNLSASVGTDELEVSSPGLADALSNAATETLAEVIVPTLWESVELVPTTGRTLAAVGQELATMNVGREHRLRKQLAQVRERYDLVLIDCPPSLDVLSVNAFTAADALVVVTHPEWYSGDGLVALFQTMQEVREYCARPDLSLAGVVFNAYEKQTKIGARFKREITEAADAMAAPVIHPPVPKRITLMECVVEGVQLHESRDRRAAELVPVFDRHLSQLTGSQA